MVIHLLSGFLGSGKTTAIRQACRSLQKNGVRVGVITNDQGIKLVDGYYFKKLGIPERQVGNGCFCCNYNDLDKNIGELIEKFQPEVIFAESVGSCTDIAATVAKPLSKYRAIKNISLTTVVDSRLLDMILKEENSFDDDVKYIFFKQLEEAGIILLNKTDLVSDDVLTKAKKYLVENYAGKEIILQNSILGNGGIKWLNRLNIPSKVSSLPVIDVNYDQYASGEAKMGYLDQHLHINSSAGNAEAEAVQLISRFMGLIQKEKATIGHVKFWLNDLYKISYTSTTTTDPLKEFNPHKSDNCTIIVNARVQIDPERLNELMNEAIESSEAEVSVISSSFFKPVYPKPLHRIAD